MSSRKQKITTKQQIALKRAELDDCFDSFSSVKRTNNLNWLRRQIAFEEPQILCPVPKQDLDETSMSNIATTYDYIMANKSQEINIEDIRIIHAKLCSNTNIDGYNFRTTNCKLRMSIDGMTYNAPDYSVIDYELRQIIYNMKHSKHDVLTRAYDAHYEMIMLQPFDDFNKRTARLIMNWVLLQNGYRPIAFNKRSDKAAYISALQSRACGDKRAYTEYMAKCQLRTQEGILKHLRESKIY